MKQFLIIFTLFILIGILISCEFGEREDTNPVEPEDVTLTVLTPVNNDTMIVNSSYTITWESNTTKKLNIEYSVDDGITWKLITENIENSGSYKWEPVPKIVTEYGKVRITVADSSITALNDGYFILTTSNIILVTSPNGNEKWPANSSQAITWYSKDVQKVNLEYTTDNGLSWTTIDTNVVSNGYYTWDQIPNTPSSNAKVRITDVDDPLLSDNSDYVFTIEPAEVVTILEPNGGEEWVVGSNQYIKWSTSSLGKVTSAKVIDETDAKLLKIKSAKLNKDIEKSDETSSTINKSAAAISNVNIEYSVNGGAEWKIIDENVVNNGAYLWEGIPDENSAQCLVRVINANGDYVLDVSDGTFSILKNTPQSVTVKQPNGGEILQTGANINIVWESENIEKVKIEYSINAGANWTLLADQVKSTGTYTWTNIPDINSNQVRVRISDAVDNIPADISDANFAITNQIVQLIEVTSPNGSEVWEANTSKKITWSSTAITNVKIEYTANNGLEWIVVEDNIESAGSYDWTVPNLNSTQAKIRVSDAIDGNPADESNGTFKIKQAGHLKLLKPEASQVLVAGADHLIKWESQNVEKVKIEYTTTDAVYDPDAKYFDDDWFTLVDSVPGAGGFYETSFTTASNKYKLRISDAQYGDPVDFSALFTVKEQPEFSITVTSPNGGESWLIGEQYEINWITNNIDRVSIDYSLNSGTSWKNIVENIGGGFYKWVIPATDYDSDLCRIRVRQSTDSSIVDISDEDFSIHSDMLRVISPNGGEELDATEQHSIRWETSPSISKVNILYTLDNGAKWLELVNNYNSNGSYSWNPPDVPSSLARIKIVNAADPSVFDVSDAAFSLVVENEAILTLVSPNGSEILLANTDAEIKWTSKNVANIKIEFSPNRADWQTVVNSWSTQSAYSWTVPDISSENCAVRISDVTRPDVVSESEAPFSITNQVVQTLTVVSPNGGEEWEAGTPNNITWQTNLEKVSIDYSINNGIVWNNIVSDLNSQGAYEWVIPGELNSTQVKVRIRDFEDNDPADESDGTFVIKPKPEITGILSPKSGDVFSVGEDVEIKWESTGIKNVGIKYTTTNGIGSSSEPAFYDLVTNLGNEGSYTTRFTIPSEEYFVVIYDADESSGVQAQSGDFIVADISNSGYANSIRIVSQSVSQIGVQGSGSIETCNLVFEVLDSNAVPIDKNHITDVSFTIINGPGGGEFISAGDGSNTAQTDAFGRVSASVSSGTVAGVIRVQAELTGNDGRLIRSSPIPITVHGGWPDENHFSVASPKLNYPLFGILGTEIEFTALVGDEYSNAVKPETDVYFRTDAGVISGHGQTDFLGRAIDTLVSGAPWPADPTHGAGYFRVYASTVNKDNQNIETSVLRLFSGISTVSIQAASINIADGGSQTISFTVSDQNGNPLSEETKITASIKTEGDAEIVGATDIELGDILFGGTNYSVTIYDTEPGTVNPAAISLTIYVDGDNGKTSAFISGTTN